MTRNHNYFEIDEPVETGSDTDFINGRVYGGLR